MTTAHAFSARPAIRPKNETEPELHVIEGRKLHRISIPIVVTSLVLLMLAIISPMVMNTTMAQTSYLIREQQTTLNRLQAESWALQTQIQDAASPVNLQKLAVQQGLVPAGEPGIISLQTGSVEGGIPAK